MTEKKITILGHHINEINLSFKVSGTILGNNLPEHRFYQGDLETRTVTRCKRKRRTGFTGFQIYFATCG